jgi:hypothetical protein
MHNKCFKADRPLRLVPSLHFVSSVVNYVNNSTFWRLPIKSGAVILVGELNYIGGL